MYEVDRLTFLMALVKQTGNSNDFPEPEDGDFTYFLTPDEKSGYVLDNFQVQFNYGLVDESEVVYSFS